MDYKTAQKTAEAQIKKKQTNDYMMIKFTYALYIVLPYDQAIQMLELLKYAEKGETDYRNDFEKIMPLDLDRLELTPITYNQYLQSKMASLMDIPISTLRDIQMDTEEPETA